jgi:hypothetical protein
MQEVGQEFWSGYIEWYGKSLESYTLRTENNVTYYENNGGVAIGAVADDGDEKLYLVNPTECLGIYCKLIE